MPQRDLYPGVWKKAIHPSYQERQRAPPSAAQQIPTGLAPLVFTPPPAAPLDAPDPTTTALELQPTISLADQVAFATLMAEGMKHEAEGASKRASVRRLIVQLLQAEANQYVHPSLSGSTDPRFELMTSLPPTLG